MKKKMLLWLMVITMILPIIAIIPVHAAVSYAGTWVEDTDEDVSIFDLKQSGIEVYGELKLSVDGKKYSFDVSGFAQDKYFEGIASGNAEGEEINTPIKIVPDTNNPNGFNVYIGENPQEGPFHFSRKNSGQAQATQPTQPASTKKRFEGTWKFATNWGDIVYVEQDGDTLYGTYYFENGKMKGTFTGKVQNTSDGQLFKGTWCQNYEGRSDGGIEWRFFNNGTYKLTWGSGEKSTGYENEVERISAFYPEKKIKRSQGLGDTTTNTAGTQPQTNQQNPQEQKPKDEVVIATAENTGTPKADNPVNIAVTGGSAKDTTQVFNGVTGVTVNFKTTNAIGYRLYRSESSNDIGISVTDFYITSKNFTDVNAEANTEYYYTLKEVLAEAKPLESIPEKEGKVLATWKVKTASDLNQGFKNPTATRHFAMLKIDDPMMSVDGIEKEVDPGRGTTPKIVRNRTVLPIRSVVESMDGTAGWDQGTRTVSLQANGNKVVMTIDKKDFTVNGQSTKLDVPPFIDNSRTYVPVRFSAQNLNCKVDWLNSTRQIVIVWTD